MHIKDMVFDGYTQERVEQAIEAVGYVGMDEPDWDFINRFKDQVYPDDEHTTLFGFSSEGEGFAIKGNYEPGLTAAYWNKDYTMENVYYVGDFRKREIHCALLCCGMNEKDRFSLEFLQALKKITGRHVMAFIMSTGQINIIDESCDFWKRASNI